MACFLLVSPLGYELCTQRRLFCFYFSIATLYSSSLMHTIKRNAKSCIPGMTYGLWSINLSLKSCREFIFGQLMINLSIFVADSVSNLTRSDRQSSVEMSIRIIFPQPFSAEHAGDTQNAGDVCFTPDDTPGVCKRFSECTYYKNYASRHGQASRIRFCRMNGSRQNNSGDSERLICCPGTFSFYINVCR